MTAEAKAEAACVLAKHYCLQDEYENVLSLILSESITSTVLPAELFFLLGEYYEKKGRWTDAVLWYKKAALEAECYVSIAYGSENALRQAIRLLKEHDFTEEAKQYEAML